MIDLVYLYTAGSNTNEIRYSLRSFQKHVSGIGKVFIVGDDPGIFKGVTIIPIGNIHGFNQARNIYEKILAACRHPEVSNPFMCASDDYILLHDYKAADLPFYYYGTFKEPLQWLAHDNKYRAYVTATNDALLEKDLPIKFFNVHFPILYDKEKFIEVMGLYDWERPKSFIAKSLYANTMRIEGKPTAREKKFHHPKTRAAICRQLIGCNFFSTADDAMNEPMLEVLQELYPLPSPLEK